MSKFPLKPIEAAWQSYRKMVLPPDAGEIQIQETRQAFFAGATILFTTIMMELSAGPDCQRSDIELMDKLNREIEEFGQQLDLAVLKPNTH